MKNVMVYEKTGTVKSRGKDINYFRDLSTTSMLYGVGREVYRRYSVEIWMFIALGSIAYQVWYRLGL